MRRFVKYVVETDYDNLKDSLKKVEYGAKVGLIVDYKDIDYEFILNMKKNSDGLICFGSSIIAPEKREMSPFGPLSNRESLNFDKSIIHYKNPTRYDDFSDDYFLENIKNMIVLMFDFFSIDYENIIFYGSGLGVFESLMLANWVNNSMVLADIPQLDLLNYCNFGENVFDILCGYYSQEELSNINQWHDDIGDELNQRYFDRMKMDYIQLDDEDFYDFSNNLSDEYGMIFDAVIESKLYTELDLRIENKLLTQENNGLKAKVDGELHRNRQVRKQCYDSDNKIKNLKKENIKLALLNMQLTDKINKLS